MIEVKKTSVKVDTAWDTVIIQNWIDGINGGKSLDLTGFNDEYLKAGHVVIKEGARFKPLIPSGGNYPALTSGQKYIGVVYKTHNPKIDGTAIMTRGKVNEKAYKNWTGLEYTDAIKSGLGLIEFGED